MLFLDKKDSNLNRISYEFSLLPMQNNCPVIEDKIFNAAPYPYLNIILRKNNLIKQMGLGMVYLSTEENVKRKSLNLLLVDYMK
ncbi:hypothetical protein AJ82_04610 [Bacillus velezensis TrigoCor1448]|nr:hypothetical protein AJ82_04610 [Bacillus velezensis TrigoCor1448]